MLKKLIMNDTEYYSFHPITNLGDEKWDRYTYLKKGVKLELDPSPRLSVHAAAGRGIDQTVSNKNHNALLGIGAQT